ncbi:hypothetical protein COX97_04395, partial [Candidatus Pacearchaeota archaeon CG_4_10_14_0_2_um_filter_05_32_18]
DYDGRPIFGITCRDAVKDLKEIDDRIEIIPAHCLLPNEKIICNPEQKAISDVKIGDKVLTHSGIYKKVIKNYSRDFNGKAYRIKPYYFRDGLRVTGEHPFLAIKTVKDCQYIGGLCKPNSIAKGKHECKEKHYENYKPNWISAENLEVNDILLYPRPKETGDTNQIKISEIIGNSNYRFSDDFIVPNIGRQDNKIKNIINITPEFCRLMGYYLAEGCIVKKSNQIQFSFAFHEKEYINDVIYLMENYFGLKIGKIRERNGYELHYYSKALVDLFSKLFYDQSGQLRAHSKRLPDWALYLPLDKQVEVFKGWWMGDAGVTVSETLSSQFKLICLRLGIIPSIQIQSKDYFNNRGTKIGDRTIISYHDIFTFHNLSFYEDKFNLLEDSIFKRFKTKLQRKHGWMDRDYVYIPIKEIEIFDYKGPVYNLEVEDDHSYVTSSATVHNCMTPWFGLFGSKSGFDSLKECFGEQLDKIHAIESGMSADPSMLWRFEEVANGKVRVVSFSDAHSFWPWRIGREATIFDIEELSYDNIIKAIRTGQGLKGTIETPPEYGRYHWDGHRNCNFSCGPEETKKLNRICPKCGGKLIIGVEYRVEELAKKNKGFTPKNSVQFRKLLPLHELLVLHTGSGIASKGNWEMYNSLIEKFGNEFNILLRVNKEDLISKEVKLKLIDLIIRNREGKIKIKPGYDGEYGVAMLEEQKKLF